MKIPLPVDAAYAFDYLAILYVKQEHGMVDHDYRDEVIWAIREAIGDSTYVHALNSGQFFALLTANRNIFDAIELAHKDKIEASKVQEINYQRYLAKRALQERFFPETPLTEQKTPLR